MNHSPPGAESPRRISARMPAPRTALGRLLAIAAPLLLAGGPASPALAARFNIYTEAPGVHRVRFEDLGAEALPAGPIPSASLGLTTSGRPVPIHVSDGGDGRFGPGDSFEFLAERLAGEFSPFNDHTPFNVYVLDPNSAAPARVVSKTRSRSAAGSGASTASPYRSVRRDERELLLLRFSDHRRGEVWYWTKLTYLDKEPFRHRFDLPGLDTSSPEPVRLRAAFRGVSQPTSKMAGVGDHRVELVLNERQVATDEWNGIVEGRTVEVPGLSAASFHPDENTLEIRVPARPQTNGDPLVDVVALNWIELEYPRTALVPDDRQESLVPSATGGSASLQLESPSGRPIVAWSDSGDRRYTSTPPRKAGPVFRQGFSGLSGEDAIWVVPAGAERSPVSVEPVREAGLASPSRQADYVMIVHPRLREAIEPLARFHRERGLSVAVVDVREIYDEFNHGILHPRAIRDFLATADRTWRRPAPRFVLLVGDASWDSKNRTLEDAVYPDTVYRPAFKASFFTIQSTPYPERAKVNHRNLIPTWSYDTRDGHAAGDNWFAALGAPDDLPRLAIGRLPVTEPEEVAAIVAKTIAYARNPPVGPWRRRGVWITNGTEAMRRFSDVLSKELAPRGLGALKVFPEKKEKDNAVPKVRIREAFSDGQLFVHFNGHGGRFIWLTALPRYDRSANDLFTLADLDLLAPTKRLPIVLSMTCYSAPFDHPSADSIGEKLLRLPEKGAVAVVAASWRNAPTLAMSRSLLEELTTPGTVGEALQRAKRRTVDRDFLEQYNVLGDPALPVALPAWPLALEVGKDACGPLSVRGGLPGPRFDGRLLVEWVDEKGDVLESVELSARGAAFAVPLNDPGKASRVRGVSVYAWDERAGIDGMGGAEILSEEVKKQDATRPEE
ncbi:MAG: C25 family cysteine peptidase [Thermoanaerobaculia bacterium]